MLSGETKILLVLLPFWDPQIPPLGIACIRTHLQEHGCRVKIVDANISGPFRDIYTTYFETLKACIPENKRGNYYKIAHEVLRNHSMAYFNYTHRGGYPEEEYRQLVRIVIEGTFYTELAERQTAPLDRIIGDLFLKLGKYVRDLLEAEKPSVLGLSVYSDTLPASLFAFKLAREINPAIVTVMGGGIFADQLALSSPNMEFFLENTPYIDKIFIGEGELLFREFLQGALSGVKRIYTARDIGNKLIDLSAADIPDFSGLELKYYPYLSAYASRSCPFQCSFCSETVNWGRYRKKSVGQVVKELNKLSRQHDSRLFLMGDSLLNPIITDLAREFIQTGISVYWDGYLRIDASACDPDNTMLWRRGGFYRARLGVESGSPRVLELMDKRITPGQIKATLVSLADAGIKTTTYWVVGHPGETGEDFQQTLDLIEELRDYIYEADCTPFQYFPGGQSDSDKWAHRYTCSPVYNHTAAREMLLVQTWTLEVEPSREETYKRMNRFTRHCDRLGIPNPYSLRDSYHADERWKRMHKNAVPSLLEFKRNPRIDESKNAEKIFLAGNKPLNDLDFGF
jgi:radical SAM superfamily enzyme YgiQ (UPF0313 family)